jgi:NAD(P) transhydrogenase subunit alpha
MIIGVPAESVTGERRVALIPESIQRLIAAEIDVCVEKGADHLPWFSDEDYLRAGAKVESSAQSLYEGAAFIVKIRSPSPVEVERIPGKM